MGRNQPSVDLGKEHPLEAQHMQRPWGRNCLVNLKSSKESCMTGEGDQVGQGRDGAESPGWGWREIMPGTISLMSAPEGERLHNAENNFAATKTGQLLSSADGELTWTVLSP